METYAGSTHIYSRNVPLKSSMAFTRSKVNVKLKSYAYFVVLFFELTEFLHSSGFIDLQKLVF